MSDCCNRLRHINWSIEATNEFANIIHYLPEFKNLQTLKLVTNHMFYCAIPNPSRYTLEKLELLHVEFVTTDGSLYMQLFSFFQLPNISTLILQGEFYQVTLISFFIIHSHNLHYLEIYDCNNDISKLLAQVPDLRGLIIDLQLSNLGALSHSTVNRVGVQLQLKSGRDENKIARTIVAILNNFSSQVHFPSLRSIVFLDLTRERFIHILNTRKSNIIRDSYPSKNFDIFDMSGSILNIT